MTELVVTEPKGLPLLAALHEAGAVINETGLVLPPDMPYDAYEAVGRMLYLTRENIQWLIGDWLNYGEDTYESDIYTQAAHMTGASTRSLYNWKYVAHSVPPQRRLSTVDYSHHAEVASLSASDQKRILKVTERDGLSKMQVRDLANEARGNVNGRQEVLDRELCPHCGRPLP